MNYFIFLFYLIINGLISYSNARIAGRCYSDAKAQGGWTYFMTWCTIIMAACGWTWITLAPTALILGSLGVMKMAYAIGAIELGYLFLIIPILGTGLAIWVDSLTTFYRQRDLASGATAAWNTYATCHNTFAAMSEVPSAFSHVSSLLSNDDGNDNFSAVLMIALVIIALGAGYFITWHIVQSSAREYGQEILATRND